jgi:hypothetical protein
MKRVYIFGLMVVCGTAAGCGSGDEDKGDNGAAQINAISASIANPTGTLDNTTAVSVAQEYEKISETSAGALRLQSTSSASQTLSCPNGGTYSVNASGDQSNVQETLSYNNCCYEESCCFSGGGNWYFSTAGGNSFSYCGNYNLSLSCDGESLSEKYSGCFSASGEWTYVVTVDSKTFAVTGSIYSGSGTLSISAANGSFSCTYTNYSGSCTGSGSFSF